MVNERVRELAKQAGLLATTLGPTVESSHMKKKEQDLAKFALLIARECLYNMQNCDGDLDFAIWKTKKDFGVNDEKI